VKKCTKCGLEKEEKEFSKNNNKKDKLACWCKKCYKQYNKNYRKENIEKLILKSRENYRKDPQKHGILTKRYYRNHIKELSEYSKIWYKNNREYRREQIKKYDFKNKEYLSKYKKIHTKKFSLYISYYSRLSPYEECRKDPNNEELLQVKCKNCGEWFNPVNIQSKHRIQCIRKTRLGDSFFFCSYYCKDKFTLRLTDEDYLQYKLYCKASDKYLYRIYKKEKWWINPDDLPRGKGKDKYHVDHIFSKIDGFKNKVPIEILNNPFNLRMLSENENCSKNGDSYITLGELYEDYKLWEELYE
jgi:hypothetical protein